MQAFWQLARYMLRYRRIMVLALIAAFVSALTFGAGLLAMQPVISALIDPDGPALREFGERADERVYGLIPDGLIQMLPTDRFDGVVLTFGTIIVLTVFGATVNFLHAYWSMTVAIRAVVNIRRAAYDKLIRLPMREILRSRTTDTISRIVRDTNMLRRGFTALLSKAIAQITKGMAGLAVAIIVEWRITLITLIVAPVVAVVIRKFGKVIRRSANKALAQSARLLGALTESVQGIRVVKVHGGEWYERGRFNRINREVMKAEFLMRTARAASSPVVEALSTIVLCVLATVACWYVLNDQLEPEKLIVSLAALGMAAATIKPITNLMNDLQESAGAAERICTVMDLPTEDLRTRELPSLPRHEESIEFRDVTFAYPEGERDAVREATLRVEAGETVAFVGPNGSGKTTLLSLVPRLFDPREGYILIDGKPIEKYNIRSLRRQIGVVTQDTVLFDDTIASNIAYGSPGAAREQIIEAAKQAFAHTFITEKPGGYDAQIGERGVSLSGGQRQRLAIARAILRDPAILILDEATSMVDAKSEEDINKALRGFCAGRTTLLIAHRLSTVLQADRIVVMDEGRVIDMGRHEELLERCAVYQQICQTQLALDATTT
jgi:ABC-type multidrug transport system fused ATPase/permease subunit